MKRRPAIDKVSWPFDDLVRSDVSKNILLPKEKVALVRVL